MNSVYAGKSRREWINIALLRDQGLRSVCFQHTTCIPEALSCHFPSYVSWGHFAPNHVPCLQCWLLFDSPNCYSFFNMNCAFRIWTLWDHSRTNVHRCAKLIENILIVVILIFNGYIFLDGCCPPSHDGGDDGDDGDYDDKDHEHCQHHCLWICIMITVNHRSCNQF